MNNLDFTFSDTVGGYVVDFNRDQDIFTMKTSDDRQYSVKFSPSTYAKFSRNLGDSYQDCTGKMRDMLVPGRHLFVYGVFYPESAGVAIESQYLLFSGDRPGDFNFEQADWWIKQIQQLGEFYMNAQFEGQEIDYRKYRTAITLAGKKVEGATLQEVDTISRLDAIDISPISNFSPADRPCQLHVDVKCFSVRSVAIAMLPGLTSMVSFSTINEKAYNKIFVSMLPKRQYAVEIWIGSRPCSFSSTKAAYQGFFSRLVVETTPVSPCLA
jgi:hypothetical protein